MRNPRNDFIYCEKDNKSNLEKSRGPVFYIFRTSESALEYQICVLKRGNVPLT